MIPFVGGQALNGRKSPAALVTMKHATNMSVCLWGVKFNSSVTADSLNLTMQGNNMVSCMFLQEIATNSTSYKSWLCVRTLLNPSQ